LDFNGTKIYLIDLSVSTFNWTIPNS